MAATTTKDFVNLLTPGYRRIMYDDYKMIPEQYPDIFNIASSTKAYETDSKLSGLGTMPEKPEGEPVDMDNPLNGEDKVYTHVAYGLGFEVTEEMQEDDLYDKMNKVPKSLSQSARVRIEQTAANVFNNGFTDSALYLGADGEPLFGDGTTKAHTNLDGTTVYNQLPTAADPADPATVEQMLIYWRKMTNDRNQVISIPATYIVVAPEQEFAMLKILNSTLEAGTAENQTNVLKGRLKLITWDYLTDTNASFILSAKQYHSLTFFWRRKLTFKGWDEPSSGNALFKASMRFSVGYTDFRGVLGNPGN